MILRALSKLPAQKEARDEQELAVLQAGEQQLWAELPAEGSSGIRESISSEPGSGL